MTHNASSTTTLSWGSHRPTLSWAPAQVGVVRRACFAIYAKDSGYAWDADPFRLEVHDLDPALPVPPGDADDRGGRGLRIVNELADDWGASHDQDGKTVWAEFRRGSEGRVARSATPAKPSVEPGKLEQPGDRPDW